MLDRHDGRDREQNTNCKPARQPLQRIGDCPRYSSHHATLKDILIALSFFARSCS